MSKKETSANKKLVALIADLKNRDSKKQMTALKALRLHGNETVIESMLDLYLSTESEEIREEIADILNTAKAAAVPAEIARIMGIPKYESLHQMLLISIWSSGLDYRDYLRNIIEAGINGKMMEALECITIVENIEGEISEDQLLDTILILKEYLVANKNEQSPKMDMMKEILVFLQAQNDAN
jgi:hypothetical protein